MCSESTSDLMLYLEESEQKNHQFFRRLMEKDSECEVQSQKLTFDMGKVGKSLSLEHASVHVNEFWNEVVISWNAVMLQGGECQSGFSCSACDCRRVPQI